MALVEAIIFLITPTLEIVVPLAFLVIEAIFWLAVALIALLKGIFTLKRPALPKWVTFGNARAMVANKAIRWRTYKEKRASKSRKNS